MRDNRFFRERPRRAARTAEKKTAQGQPGEVGATLSRRMGPALASIFSKAGTNLYSSSVLAIKEQLQDLFQTTIGELEGEIKEELGRRGQSESVTHFGPWIKGLVEDIVQFGMPEIGGALEDLAGTLTAEFVQEEEGEEELLGMEEEEAPEEEVEVVEEEPVEAPPEEAPEEAEGEMGLEELMAPAEEAPAEGEAPASTKPLGPRTWRSKKPVSRRYAGSKRHATLELKDLFAAVGGSLNLRRKAKTAAQARKLLAAIQSKVVGTLSRRFGAVTEVEPRAIEAWIKRAYRH